MANNSKKLNLRQLQRRHRDLHEEVERLSKNMSLLRAFELGRLNALKREKCELKTRILEFESLEKKPVPKTAATTKVPAAPVEERRAA